MLMSKSCLCNVDVSAIPVDNASQRWFCQEGNRAPWGLYMHAAWFFGQDWHFQGYKMFIEVTIKIFVLVTSH